MPTVTSKDCTTIAFDRSGKGAPLILVGGAFQYRAIDQRKGQLPALPAQHFTVYRYDRRGRGDSSDTLPHAVEREIEDLEALLEAAGGSAFAARRRASLCGRSFQRAAPRPGRPDPQHGS